MHSNIECSTTGKCCLTAVEGYIYDGLAVVRMIDQKIHSKYLHYFFDNIYNHINNSKSGAAFPNINTDFLNLLNFPLPPLEIQDRIVAKLDELMQFCDQFENSVKESQKLNEQLLQQVLREALQPKTKEEVLPLVAEDREEKYDLWLSNQGLAARGTMDEKTLREIFDAMDDEDK